ncbi:MAG TPA: hypothetical protein VMK05_12885 [Burkholderiales bacterium]|nr:hypothetical protein [Burkholderiales bacterium]
MNRNLSLFAVAALLAGCGTLESNNTSDKTFVIPDKTWNISPSLQVPLEGVVAAAAVYFIVDPLAPNWQVSEQRLSGEVYRIALRMKRFTTGGDGEAMQVFRRSAERLARDGGYAGYRVLQYTEGIESNVPLAQRVGEGTVELVKAQ